MNYDFFFWKLKYNWFRKNLICDALSFKCLEDIQRERSSKELEIQLQVKCQGWAAHTVVEVLRISEITWAEHAEKRSTDIIQLERYVYMLSSLLKVKVFRIVPLLYALLNTSEISHYSTHSNCFTNVLWINEKRTKKENLRNGKREGTQKGN